MPDEPDDSISLTLDKDQVAVRIFEQCIHIRALLSLLIEIQTETLAHLTGKDSTDVFSGQIDRLDQLVAQYVNEAHQAGKTFVIDEDE